MAASRAVLVLVMAGACGAPQLEACPETVVGAGAHRACTVPGWLDRGFFLDVPPQWDGSASLPVIVLLHGGGGSRQSANRATCPSGFDWRFGDRWHLVPELSLHGTAAGHVPVDGGVAMLGVALARDF